MTRALCCLSAGLLALLITSLVSADMPPRPFEELSGCLRSLPPAARIVPTDPAATPCEALYRELWRMEVLLTRARLQLDVGKVADAEESCRAAQAIGLWDARLQSLLGEVRFRQRRWTEAIVALRTSPLGERDQALLADALVMAGWERHDNNQPADALRLWSEAVELSPNHGLALASLGLALLLRGDVAQAVGKCRDATENAPELAFSWGCLGLALHAAGELGPAEAATLRALEKHPDDPVLTSNLAFIALDRGDNEGAVRLWEAALAKDHRLPDAWAGLGVAYWRRGNQEAGIWAYRNATTRDAIYLSWEKLAARRLWSPAAAVTAGEIVAALQSSP